MGKEAFLSLNKVNLFHYINQECSGIQNVYFEDKFEDGWRMDLNFTLDMGVKLW